MTRRDSDAALHRRCGCVDPDLREWACHGVTSHTASYSDSKSTYSFPDDLEVLRAIPFYIVRDCSPTQPRDVFDGGASRQALLATRFYRKCWSARAMEMITNGATRRQRAPRRPLRAAVRRHDPRDRRRHRRGHALGPAGAGRAGGRAARRLFPRGAARHPAPAGRRAGRPGSNRRRGRTPPCWCGTTRWWSSPSGSRSRG